MPKAAKSNAKVSRGRLLLYHALLLGGVFAFWYLMTEPGLITPFYFDDPTRAKFFFGNRSKCSGASGSGSSAAASTCTSA